MSHRDTSVAIKKAINQALNATQSSKRIYPGTIHLLSKSTRTQSTRLQFVKLSMPLPLGAISIAIKQAFNQALKATQGPKHSYKTSY